MAYPVRDVIRPSMLAGQSNGHLPDGILVKIPGQAGGPVVRLVAPAAAAFQALAAAAKTAGITLKASGPFDSYRPYDVQVSTFESRYTTTKLAGRPTRVWQGHTWYQRPGTAVAAVPGTSNHGWGLAVDVGCELDGDAGTEPLSTAALNWLVGNEERYGFSHEIPSEPWHIRFWAGDHPPAAAAATTPRGDDVTFYQVAAGEPNASAVFAITVNGLYHVTATQWAKVNPKPALQQVPWDLLVGMAPPVNAAFVLSDAQVGTLIQQVADGVKQAIGGAGTSAPDPAVIEEIIVGALTRIRLTTAA